MTVALRKISAERDTGSYHHSSERALLEHLRNVARSTRCKSYVDLFGACAALSRNSYVGAQAASDVLMRCLSQALGQRLVLYREGERETSFDEDWLMALARSMKHDDTASATFLLHSRAPKHSHRNLVFLLRNVVDSFSQV